MFQIKEDANESAFGSSADQREKLISDHVVLIRLHASRLSTQLPARISLVYSIASTHRR